MNISPRISSSLAYPETNPSVGSLTMTVLVLKFYVIYYFNNTNGFEAIECALRFGGATYNSSVQNEKTLTVAIGQP
jgi:hypothetical protein